MTAGMERSRPRRKAARADCGHSPQVRNRRAPSEEADIPGGHADSRSVLDSEDGELTFAAI